MKKEELKEILAFLEEKQGLDITVYKEPVNWISDAIIVTATSPRHIHSLLDYLYKMRFNGDKLDIEGKPESGWVVASLNGFVLHFFTKDQREYYTLDQMWEKNMNKDEENGIQIN